MVLDNKIVRRYFTWALDTTRESHLRTLSDVPLFTGMGKKLLRKLLIDLIEKKYTAGDIIFHEGESGKAVYVVIEGSVKIIKKSNSESKTLAVLGPGSHFGELSLIGQCSRFATAVAEKDSLLLIMYKSYFDDLIRGNSAISSRILLNLAEILSKYIQRDQPE
ncbi:MAG TPA: cyclic nucleotide-binding domain-containing protein [Thermodesulfovibrionales bacterium]|nr:cyclic nucleotide-binding domain-containing protein [Thermodesulfovibrionales bacterium]